MAFPNFAPSSIAPSAWANLVSRPRFAATPDRAGDIALVRDEDLDQGDSSLLARANLFLGAFLTTKGAGLNVIIGGGTVVLADGTPVSNPTTQRALPANAVSFIWANPQGAITVGQSQPNDGSVLISRATTDVASVVSIDDLRPRFKIGDQTETAPGIIGEGKMVLFPVQDRLWTDEQGWKWLSLSGGTSISRGSASGDVATDEIERLFKRLWNTPTFQLRSSSAIVARGSSSDADWDAGRILSIADPAGHTMIAAGSNDGVNYSVGSRIGERAHVQTQGEMPSHNHSAVADPHNHGYDRTEEESSDDGFFDEGDQEGRFGGRRTTNEVVRVTIGTRGGNEAMSLMQPSFVATMLMFTGIKAA